MKKRLALISVNNKSGLKEFVAELEGLGCGFVASKVCARLLNKWGFDVEEVSKITGYPPVMG
jgi:AICAR transformylase/IMP cyclohydrolase PurH